MTSTTETSPRPELPFVSFIILPDLFLSLVIALRPGVALRLIAFVVFVYINVRGLGFTTGDAFRDYGVGSVFSGQILVAVHLLWLHDPLSEFRHELDQISPQSMPLWRRVYWAICVIHSPRGIGWNTEVPKLPPRPTEPRWTFVSSRLMKALGFFFLLDLAQSYVHSNPLFSLTGDDVLPITAQGYVLRCVSIMAWAAVPYGQLNMQYNLLASLAVAVGFSEPKYWTPIYGSLIDAYTLRRFWGRTWHQLLRRITTSMGQFCSRSLGCSPNSMTALLVQLFVAFMVSGFMHAAGDAMVGIQHLGGSLPFFLAQSVAITFETVVIGVARRAGYIHSNIWIRLVGYTWVLLWLSISMPWILNWAVSAGLGHSEVLPISPIRSTTRALQQCTGIQILPN